MVYLDSPIPERPQLANDVLRYSKEKSVVSNNYETRTTATYIEWQYICGHLRINKLFLRLLSRAFEIFLKLVRSQ